jgi:hypothetical protein
MFVPIDTNCNECIFKDGYDCRINRIALYKSKGITVVAEPSGTTLKEFVCPYYRTEEWLQQHKTSKDIIRDIKKENGLPYLPILLFMEGKLLKDSLKKIKSFTIKPKEVFIIVKTGVVLHSVIQDIRSVLDNSDITWHLHVELEDLSWHGIFKFYNRPEFLLIINGYPEVSNTWPEIIANKVQDELLKFSYAENKSQTMMLIAPYIYKAYYFEHTKDFIKQLRVERHRQKCIL